VLRGPQGTLFGRNATGGLANFVTRRPTAEPGGYVNLTIGERNLTRIEGAVNGAIKDGINGRLSFQSNHYDPLFKNAYGGAADAENGNDWALRGQLSFDLPNTGNLLLSAHAARSDVHAGSWEVYTTKNLGPGVNGLADPSEDIWGTGAGNNATGVPGGQDFTTHDNLSGFAKIKTSGLTAHYSQPVGGATLTVIGDYTKLRKDYAEDSDASPFTLFQFFNGSDVDQQSLEARLNGGDKTLNWTAGVYGMRINGKYFEGWQGPAFWWAKELESASNPNNSNYIFPGAWPDGTPPFFTTGGIPGTGAALPITAGGVPATRAPYELLTKSYAAFGQVEWRVSDLIGVTAGARITKDKKDYHYTWFPYIYYPQSTTGQITQLTPPSAANLINYDNSRSDTLTSGKVQVDFHLSDNVLTYVSYNRGVKGGGFNAPLFPAFESPDDIKKLKFRPEKLTNYEVGFKSELLDHTLRFNAAAYYYDYKDYQALLYTISLNQLVVNADATHKGAEAELEWAPNQSWRLGLGVGYVDAVVKDIDSRGTGIPGDYVAPNAPKWSTNALAAYTLPVGSGKLSFQVDGNYLSKFWFNLGNTPAVEQKAFGVANARINWATDKYEFGVSLENLADKHYGVMGFDNTSINGLAQRYPGMPRWFKAHVNYKF
jgi:iron complex outermembrane receptor protein